MAMNFGVTIAYAVEVPDYSYDSYEDDIVTIFTECEAGDRIFIGVKLIDVGADGAITSKIPFNVPVEARARVDAISDENKLTKPAIWAIGAIS